MKRRNAHAVAARARKAGPHERGTSRPHRSSQNDISEGLEEYEMTTEWERAQGFICSVTQRPCRCGDGPCLHRRLSRKPSPKVSR